MQTISDRAAGAILALGAMLLGVALPLMLADRHQGMPSRARWRTATLLVLAAIGLVCIVASVLIGTSEGARTQAAVLAFAERNWHLAVVFGLGSFLVSRHHLRMLGSRLAEQRADHERSTNRAVKTVWCLAEAHERELTSLADGHADALAKLSEECANKIAKLKSEHDNSLADARKAYSEELDAALNKEREAANEEAKRLVASIDSARIEGANEAKRELEDAERNRDPGTFLHFEPYISRGQNHGVTLHRGGHSSEYKMAVRVGIRVANFSRYGVTVREITNVAMAINGIQIHDDPTMRVVRNGNIGIGARAMHVHDIYVETSAIPLESLLEPICITVTATFMLDGPWRGAARPSAFTAQLFAPLQLDYTYEMNAAMSVLRSALSKKGMDLADAVLRAGSNGGLEWVLWFQPIISVTVPIPGHLPEEARRTEVLLGVAERAAEMARANLDTGKGAPSAS